MFSISQGVNNEDLLSYNRSLVLGCLKRKAVCSRADIAKETGLTQASISKIVATLIDYGVIREVGYMTGEMGRRSVGIALNTGSYKVIGLKISRRSFSVGVFDIGGRHYESKTIKMPENEPVELAIRHIREIITELAHAYPEVVSIGAAVPGPYFKESGMIVLFTETKGWEDIPLYEVFDNIEGLPLFIEHDANSAAMAEWLYGDYEISPGATMVYFLVDEGVGAGVVSGGRIFSGTLGTAAEIGHISVKVDGPRCACGNYGCLELYCSSLSFVRKTKERRASRPESSLQGLYYTLSCDDIFVAADRGDALALEMVEYAARYIGYGVVSLVHAYSPQVLVIGNELAKGGERLLRIVRETARQRLIPRLFDRVDIRLSASPVDPILSGAAAIASAQFYNDPTRFIGEEDIGPMVTVKGSGTL